VVWGDVALWGEGRVCGAEQAFTEAAPMAASESEQVKNGRFWQLQADHYWHGNAYA